METNKGNLLAVPTADTQTRRLTGKQQAFVSAYLGGARFNATEAARMAGYAGSAASLAQIGYENLRKPEIAREVETAMSGLQMCAAEVLTELTSIARTDTPVKETRDRLKALELLGKAAKLWTAEEKVTVILVGRAQSAYRKLREVDFPIEKNPEMDDDSLRAWVAELFELEPEMINQTVISRSSY